MFLMVVILVFLMCMLREEFLYWKLFLLSIFGNTVVMCILLLTLNLLILNISHGSICPIM